MKCLKSFMLTMFTFFIVSIVTTNVEAKEIEGTKLSFKGTSTIKADPDLANVSIYVSAFNKEANKAKEQATKTADKLKNELLNNDFGITKEDIEISNFGLREEYDYSKENFTKENKPNVIGYKATYSVNVKVKNIDKLDEMLSKVSQIENISSTYTSYSLIDNDALYVQALEEAVSQALKKADILTNKYFNGQKYNIVFIEETSFHTVYSDSNESYTLAKSMDTLSSSLPKIQTTASVILEVKLVK